MCAACARAARRRLLPPALRLSPCRNIYLVIFVAKYEKSQPSPTAGVTAAPLLRRPWRCHPRALL